MEVDELALVLLRQLLDDRHLAVHDDAVVDGPGILEGWYRRTEINLWLARQCLQGINHRLHTLAIFLGTMRPVIGLGIVGTELDDDDVRIESLRILPCQLVHVWQVALVHHRTRGHTEVLHLIAVAQLLLQLGRIALGIGIHDAKAIGDGVADASHTDGILLRRLQASEPSGEVAQHLVVVLPTATESPAMTAGRINMQLAVVALLVHGGIISHTIGDRWHDIIVVRQHQNGWRSKMVAHCLVVRPFLDQLRVVFASLAQEVDARALMGAFLFHRDDRIEEDGEVRTDGIVGMGADGRSQMSTSREAHDTYVFLINMPNGSAISYGTHRLISIAQRNVTITVRHTILQDEEGNALLVEILSPLMALMVHGEMGISTSRAIDHRTTRRVLWEITG